jgi:hypothetical protein
VAAAAVPCAVPSKFNLAGARTTIVAVTVTVIALFLSAELRVPTDGIAVTLAKIAVPRALPPILYLAVAVTSSVERH